MEEIEADVVDLTDEPLDSELSEKEMEEIKGKFEWCVEKDEETGTVIIRPMNKENCITLYGADWVRWFIGILQDTIQQ